MIRQPVYPLLKAEQFLEFDFIDRKAELDRGMIRVLDGVTARHAIVQGNIQAWLHERIRPRKCFPYGTSFPIRTDEHSVRCADVVIARIDSDTTRDADNFLDDPLVIFEITHVGPPRTDLVVKEDEYRRMASVDMIVIVDAEHERLKVVQRTGPSGWADTGFDAPHDLFLPLFGLTLPHADIFARD